MSSESMKGKDYRKTLAELHVELVRLQGYVKQSGARLLVIVEGRDASGKGGLIKRLVEPLNPRGCRVVALDRASERERGQWYFQRYLGHLPAAGEIVVFDRSWYNRAGLEVVMGYCSAAEHAAFLRAAPELERLLVEDGILLRKIYLEVSKDEQARRLEERKNDPLVQWKLSPLDLAAQSKWDEYTAASETMFAKTATRAAPWTIVAADDKRLARVNAFRWLLASVDYGAQVSLTLDPGVITVRSAG